MERRKFFKQSLGAVALPLVPGMAQAATTKNSEDGAFQLKYAPHFGMFEQSAGKSLEDQLQFMADQGFGALEDNGMTGRSIEDQNKIAQKMDQLGMEMGVFVAHKIYWRDPNLTSGNADWRKEFLEGITNSVEVAKRVNAKWVTVVPGHVDLSLEMGYQTANVVESLRQACEIFEPHGLTMVLEPLNWWAGHDGQFLTKIPQAYEICKAVNSPSCKILFDVYHQQIQEGHLIKNIDMAWDEIAYFQVGDNPGRKEPTTGEINYLNVFKHIHSKGYTGIVGMEHGNSKPGKAGEMRVIEAYKEVDRF